MHINNKTLKMQRPAAVRPRTKCSVHVQAMWLAAVKRHYHQEIETRPIFFFLFKKDQKILNSCSRGAHQFSKICQFVDLSENVSSLEFILTIIVTIIFQFLYHNGTWHVLVP